MILSFFLQPSVGFAASPVCEVLRHYPRAESEKMSFEIGEIGAVCKPFVKYQRRDLDRCGDTGLDPYSGSTHSKSTTSGYTWSSRNELAKKGKGNLYTDPDLQPQLPHLLARIEEIRQSASQLCCGTDRDCQKAMGKVEVSVCKPVSDPDASDPCVFGGSYRMAGDGYASIFRAVRSTYNSDEGREFRTVAERNLTRTDLNRRDLASGPVSGSIVLSSYVNKKLGAQSLEPVITHEFGHACSMIKMQNASIGGGGLSAGGRAPATVSRALRALRWLDRARYRCQADLELPEAYDDFWESVGETRGLAQCLRNLTIANQKQQVDRPCPNLCPGHYLEESVGIAFSLLLGNIGTGPSATFPNTCDHVRDGQHPMVSDVVECLAQNSSRFRDRLRRAYNCI
jgi:hypothetical protein